jgi:acyl-CoA reductase-like NAD-dependent aldehyde dehydrogenase
MASETLTTISPSTNFPVVTRRAASFEQLLRMPGVAQAAFRSFSRSTTLEQRQEIVAHALRLLEERKHVLARELTDQMGRPISYTPGEIVTAVKRGNYLNRVSSSILGEAGIVPGDAEDGFKRYVKRQPVGVVLIILAWNVRGCCYWLWRAMYRPIDIRHGY